MLKYLRRGLQKQPGVLTYWLRRLQKQENFLGPEEYHFSTTHKYCKDYFITLPFSARGILVEPGGVTSPGSSELVLTTLVNALDPEAGHLEGEAGPGMLSET